MFTKSGTFGEEKLESGVVNIGFGHTPKDGNSNWVKYVSDGIFINVDTSSGNFINVPLYLVSIGGSGSHWVLTGSNAIYGATNKGFTVYVRRPDLPSEVTVDWAKKSGWYINWIGIESR